MVLVYHPCSTMSSGVALGKRLNSPEPAFCVCKIVVIRIGSWEDYMCVKVIAQCWAESRPQHVPDAEINWHPRVCSGQAGCSCSGSGHEIVYTFHLGSFPASCIICTFTHSISICWY